MSKEKQVEKKQTEEMAVENLVAFLWHNTTMYDEDQIFDVAEALVNEGYHKRSEGEWIDRDGKTWCSLCGASNKQYKPPFCPHCGAKMEGARE